MFPVPRDLLTFPVIADSLSTPFPPLAFEECVIVFAAFEKVGDGEDGTVDVTVVVRLGWGPTVVMIRHSRVYIR